MSFTTAARNAMLGGFTGTHLSAHTAYSSTGTNEVTGGTPAYARKSVTYGAAASEIRTASNTPTFDIPAATTVRWIGMWDAVTAGSPAGTTRGFGEVEFREVGGMIAEVLNAISQADGGEAPLVEAAVRERVAALTDRFPIYG